MTGSRDPEALRALAAGRGRARGEAALRDRARQLWRETGELLGRLLVLLASLFSPGVAVIGGGIAGALDLFEPAARRHLAGHLAPRLGARLEIRGSALGRFAGAAGMALLAAGSSSRPT
jgi:predicted NBD/HSP70 family sugar kinase